MVRSVRLFRLPSPSRFGLALALALALALGLAAGAAVAQAPDTKKPALYPPYPDLWQRAIPMAEWVVDESSLDVEMAEDGDVVIRFGGGGRTGWIKFFSGESPAQTLIAQERAQETERSQAARAFLDKIAQPFDKPALNIALRDPASWSADEAKSVMADYLTRQGNEKAISWLQGGLNTNLR